MTGVARHRAVSLTVGALLLASCRTPAPPGPVQPAAAPLEGRWTLCLAETTRGTGPFCGPLTAAYRQGAAPGGAAGYYQLEHGVPLDSLLRTPHPHPRFGVLAPTDGERWRLLLGVEEGVVNAFDVGLHGELDEAIDSLSGSWSHSCFAGCTERGSVVLRRQQ